MNTFTSKSFPDLASLILRLSVGLPIVFSIPMIIYALANNMQGSQWLGIIYSFALLFICLGLFGRWISLALCIYVILGTVSHMQSVNILNPGVFIQLLTMVSPYIAIFFLDSGKYSLDYLIFKKKQISQ